MDEIVGLLLEQVAKKARESKRQAAAVPAAPMRLIGRPGAASGATAAPTPKPVAVPVAKPPAPVATRPPRPAPVPDPFAVAVESLQAEPPANALLAAFRGGTGLLAGIVLGEALAPPLALRERNPGHS